MSYLRLRGDDGMMSDDDMMTKTTMIATMKTNMIMIVMITRVDRASVATG